MYWEDPHEIVVRKHYGKKPPGESRKKWEDNIKMDLREIGFEVYTDINHLRKCSVSCFL
jgi:hypothetical protein